MLIIIYSPREFFVIFFHALQCGKEAKLMLRRKKDFLLLFIFFEGFCKEEKVKKGSAVNLHQ
jgi:hypothetical protein